MASELISAPSFFRKDSRLVNFRDRKIPAGVGLPPGAEPVGGRRRAMVCVHPTLPPTRRRVGQFLPGPDGQDHDGSRDQPRHYQPIRNRQRSPALYSTQRVVPIPFRFVIETARTIVGHLIAPEQVTSPSAITLARRRQSTHQRSIKQSGVFEPVGLGPRSLLEADLVHGDAGIAARLSLCAMRPFRFCRATT